MLTDFDKMKKENVTIDVSINEFNKMAEKVNELKNKIENEINKINELYEITINNLSKSFKIKHEQLIKEENNIKEKLQSEVTKAKEKLEKYFSESNSVIKINEKINQGIKNFNLDEKENNMIKNLSYVSKLNKTKKQMNELLNISMNNLKFEYKENQNNIIYEEYYFNIPIPIPKNIKFKDVYANSLDLSWEIENMNNIKISYKVEMRKKGEEFILVYEGNNTNCSVNNLNEKTDYEFRIRSSISSSFSPWTKIQKITTNYNFNCNSTILEGLQRKNDFLRQIYEWSGYKKMELLYRGTKDGPESKTFHNKCDNQGPTISLYRNDKDNIFGGYCSINWKSSSSALYVSAPKSFLFTLTNIYNTEPMKFQSKNDECEIYYNSDRGPSFGNGPDLAIEKNFEETGGYSHFPKTYIDILGKGNSVFTGNINNDEFKVKEIEVFKLFK